MLPQTAEQLGALLAGLFTAEGDVIVSVDADLQDDVGALLLTYLRTSGLASC